MIPFIQSKVVVKDSNGKQVVHGNCYQTAIACIVGIQPADVPNIETLFDIGAHYAYDVMKKWLNEKGFSLREYALEFSVFHEGSPKLKGEHSEYYLANISNEQKVELKNELKDKYYLVSGLSARGVPSYMYL